MNFLFTFSVLTLCFTTVKLIRVTVTQGTLEGEILTSVIGVRFASFKGVPYAATPNGTLRFKAPQPPSSWEGVRNATEHGSVCPQVDIFTGVLTPGNEDCLFLNVYTPTLTLNSSLPVMVFIHGGGFKSGSGNVDLYGPDFLMSYNVVLVTINYRLEALGFLCLNTKEVPGNAGLKDQVAALKWVQENIKFFGGDPDLVTIFGQSAGGASVAYHILSPMSKGLFKRAISMSGVPLCDFTTPFRPVQRAFILGKQLGINTNDTTVLLNYLQSLPSDKLFNLNPSVLISERYVNNIIKMFDFVPVIEKAFCTNSSFLTQDPSEIIKKRTINEVDMIFGYTSQETLTMIDILVNNYLPLYDRYPEMLVPTKMLLKFGSDKIVTISNIIRQHYFDNKTIDVNVIGKFVTYANEATFIYDIKRFVAMLPTCNKNTRYLYEFSAVSDRNYYGKRGLKYNFFGAGHMDDTLYLFDAKSLNMTITTNSIEYALVQKVCTLFTNFAKYGNPTAKNSLNVTWPQYDSCSISYLDIGNTLIAGTNPNAEATKFWKCIFDYAGLRFY